jgi:hypothetical protein
MIISNIEFRRKNNKFFQKKGPKMIDHDSWMRIRIEQMKALIKYGGEPPIAEVSVGQISLSKEWVDKIKAKAAAMASKKLNRPASLEPGQIWSTRVPENSKTHPTFGTKVVMLTVVEGDPSEPVLMAVPLCSDWQFAGPDDMVMNPEESPLNYHFMIQLWSEIAIRKASLGDYLGDLDSHIFNAAQAVLSWIDGLKLEHRPLCIYRGSDEDNPDLKVKLVVWNFQDNIDPKKHHEVKLGQPILTSRDPRADYRQIQLQEMDYLKQPVRDEFAAHSSR